MTGQVVSSRLPEDIYWRLPGLSAQELHQEDLGVLLTDKYRLEQVTLDRVMVNTLTVEAGHVSICQLDSKLDTFIYEQQCNDIDTVF